MKMSARICDKLRAPHITPPPPAMSRASKTEVMEIALTLLPQNAKVVGMDFGVFQVLMCDTVRQVQWVGVS
jgi:hypothetical protein